MLDPLKPNPMAAPPSPILFFLVVFLLSVSPVPSQSDSATLSVYEILLKFGLPSGLLPDSVRNYTLSSDGIFVVELDNPCYIQFDYLVYYDKRITGTLKIGSITNLKGIQVKRFFLWFDVDEIRVDLPPSDSIYFQVGVINKKLDIDQFKTVHSCRDGKSPKCGRPWLEIFQIPPPTDNDIPMLITE